MNKETWDETTADDSITGSFVWDVGHVRALVLQEFAVRRVTAYRFGATCANKPCYRFVHLHLYEKSAPWE